MLKNKKLLMFLALNSLVSTVASSSNNEFEKYENMYDKMTKKIEKNISNRNNYKLLEKILNQRNKELKDLYLQSDYIVKPEYLEWQIFFSGFYSEKDRKGTKKNSVMPFPSSSGTIDVSISMPAILMKDPDINIENVSAGAPEVSINKNNTSVSNMSYSNNVEVPEFVIPELPAVTITPPVFTISATSMFSSSSMYDKTFYNPTLGAVQTWNTGLFSNYNLESGNFSYDVKIAGSNSNTTFNFNSAAGSIDPAAIADASLNQPAVIPTSDSYSAKVTSVPMIVSTSAPNIRIGENTTINLISSNTANNYQYGTLMLQYTLTPNRSALNTDSDYAFGKGKAYPDSQAGIPFSILRNSGTINITGNYGVAGIMMNKNNQSGSRNDYLLVNDGTIIGEYIDSNSKQHIGLAFEGNTTPGTKGERYILGNDGIMEFRAPQSAAFNFGGVNLLKYQIVYNRNTINMYGSNSFGVKMANSSLSGYTPGTDQTNTKILLEDPINIYGDNSVGVYYSAANMKAEDSVFKVNIGTGKNNYSGNISGNDPNYVENSVGMYITPRNNNTTGTITNIVNYDIKFGDYAKNSIMFVNDGSSNSYNMSSGAFTSPLLRETYIDNSAVTSVNVEAGTNNIVFFNKGGVKNVSYAYIPIIYIKPDINIGTAEKAVDNTLALYNLGAIAHLNGNIETYGEYSHGIYNNAAALTSGGVVYSVGSKLDNIIDGNAKTLSIVTHGDNSAVLYNNESNIDFQAGGTFKALGKNGSVLYNKNGSISITGDSVFEAGDNGTLIMADGGKITLSGNNIYNVRNNSVFAYALGNPGIKVEFSGSGQTVNLENGSIGFVYDGGSVNMQQNSLYDYLNDNFAGLNNLNINVSDNSRLFLINNYGTLKLSELEAMNTGSGLFGSVTGNSGNSLLNKGTLVLDTLGVINLDDPNDFYSNTDKAATGITVDAGVTIKGTQDSQTALSGKDIYRGTSGGSTYVVMNNYGNIELSGDNSLGIYTNNGLINNYSEINTTGKNSAGLFGENSSVVKNYGNLKISDNGVGIYAVSYQAPDKPDEDFGSGLVDVTNTGVISAVSSEKAVGIYVNNNKTGALRNTGILNLSGGTVDMSLSKESTGVYAVNATVNGGGIINAGESGTGLYAKNSDLTLSDLTLNMNKDNSVGIYLDSDSNLNTSGTNTVNITGKKNTIFYVNTEGTFNQNFLINGNNNADYTLMYINSNKGTYNGTAVLSGNSTVFYGVNSVIELGTSSSLTAPRGNTAGIYADGLYGGITDYEGINKGEMLFGDDSAGLYGINGARLLNTGNITTGSKSLGMSSEASDYLRNKGTIKTGSNSIGMSAKNTALTENSGNIIAAGENITALYSENSGISVINNTGNIELTGKNTIGVYLEEGGQQTFNNNKVIKTENSENSSIASAGIYNNGHIVNNTGDIIAGMSTAGIYNNNGIIRHSGSITSEADGVGIYSAGGEINLTDGTIISKGFAIYAENNTKITNTGTEVNTGDKTVAYVLKSGSGLINDQNASIGTGSIYVYGNGTEEIVNNASSIIMTGPESMGYYLTNSEGLINNADITGLANGNMGIYSDKGSVVNSGNITLGDSEIIDENDSSKNRYAIGIYGEDAEVNNSGNIKTGYRGTGIYTENNKLTNSGNITSDGEYAVGLWGSKAVIENNGEIVMNGDYSQGIMGTSQSNIVNNSIITMNGNNSIGISGNEGTKIQNNGIINLYGNDSTGIMLSNGSVLLNKGTINLGPGSNNAEVQNGNSVIPPSIVNAGVIKVDGKFELNGINLTIQVDPESIRKPEMSEITTDQYTTEDLKAKFLVSDAVRFQADSFDFSGPAMIDPLFTQGTNALVYKFENVFMAKDLASAESITADSNSVTFRATPSMNENGNVDIWMEKIPYQYFTNGMYYDKMAEILDKNYVLDGTLSGQTDDALKLYDKLDLITDTQTLEKAMKDLSGEMYSNITRRMEDVSDTFNDSLEVLQNSENNTKENVKINVIAGKGKTKENRNGILPYDYSSVGILALREVERTYRHTFGYSLGYLKTNYQFQDTNNKEEADTIQAGLHNKYKADSWTFKTNLLGRAGFNNTDREIDWNRGVVSEMSGDYNTYGVTLLNEIAKDIEIGKNTKIIPYAGLKMEYGYHSDIKESGDSERLNVEQNDYYSIKPNAGLEFETAKYFGDHKNWKIKMNIGVGYEYEFGDTNSTERAGFDTISSEKFDFGESGEDKGKFITNGGVGIEFQDRYGIFMTGKYKTAGSKEEDYQLGLNLKISF